MKCIIRPKTADSQIDDYEFCWDDDTKTATIKDPTKGRVLINKNRLKSLSSALYKFTYTYSNDDFQSMLNEVDNASNPDYVTDSAAWVKPRLGCVKIIRDNNNSYGYPVYRFIFQDDYEGGTQYGRPFKNTVKFSITGYWNNRPITSVSYYDAYGNSATPKYELRWTNGLQNGQNGGNTYFANPLYAWSSYLPSSVGSQRTLVFPWCRYFRVNANQYAGTTPVTYIMTPADSLSELQNWDRYNTALTDCLNNYKTTTTSAGNSGPLAIYADDGTEIIEFALTNSTFSSTNKVATNLNNVAYTETGLDLSTGDFSYDISSYNEIQTSFEYGGELIKVTFNFVYESGSSSTDIYLTYKKYTA